MKSLLLALTAMLAAHGPASAANPPSPPPAAVHTSKGLWFGPIRLCREIVAEVYAADDPSTTLPTLMVQLKPEAQPLLRKTTEENVGSEMPIIFDGKLLMNPVIIEPITGTHLQVSGTAEDDFEQVRAAALGPC